jgi:aconitate hydratase
LVDLAELAPNQPVTCIVHHADGKKETLLLNHTYNETQVEWFKAGSALNLMS